MNTNTSSNPPAETNPKKGEVKKSTIIVAAIVTVAIVIVIMAISANNKKAEFTQKLATTEQLNAQAEKKINELTEANETAISIGMSWKSRLDSLQKVVNNLTADPDGLKQQTTIDSLVALTDSLQAEMAKTPTTPSDSTLNDLKTQIATLQSQLEEMRTENARLQAALDAKATTTPGAATDEFTEKGGTATSPMVIYNQMVGRPDKNTIWVDTIAGTVQTRASVQANIPAEFQKFAKRVWPM